MNISMDPDGPPITPTEAYAMIPRLEHMFAARYLNAAGYVTLLYDIILLLPDEIATVWTARQTVPKWGFLLYRYVALALQTLTVIGISFMSKLSWNSSFCKVVTLIGLVLCVPTIAVANALVLLRVAVLWQKRRSIVLSLFILLIVTSTVPFILISVLHFGALAQADYYDGSKCIMGMPDSRITAGLTMPLIFDVSVISVTLWNALRPPPTRSAKPLLERLSQTGFFYFCCIMTIRMFAVGTSAFHSPSLFTAANSICWTLVATIMGRFIIKIRTSESLRSNQVVDTKDQDLTTTSEVELRSRIPEDIVHLYDHRTTPSTSQSSRERRIETIIESELEHEDPLSTSQLPRDVS